ncbi:MAG: bacterial Ig-like domain-containing protein [Clostridia bacterium]|nr:bacterial Ig-like domain-containing protein [Clostridia bacterium]
MKKSIRNILVIILAVTAAVCAAIGLAACKSGDEIKSLSIENAKIDFMIGDEFTLGDDCVIYAVYGDGTKKDVTSEVEIRKENGFDMNVANDYQITVSYGGKREVYTIYVNDFTSILRKIELDTQTVKKQYALGEEVSLDGLTLILTYENAQNRLVVSKTTSLKNFEVEVKSENGTVADEVFTVLGNYTVTVSQGSVKASYTVNVNGVNISTVQSALYVGKIFKTEVASGTQKVESSLHGGGYFDDSFYDYKFGDNYTYLKNTEEITTYEPDENDPDILVPVVRTLITESHFSMDGDEVFCARFENGGFVPNHSLQVSMMEGAPNGLWYSFLNVYGIENALTELYKAAKECTNKDLVENADEANRKYSFKFSGLVNYASRPDYYETEVTFTLGEKYNIESVTYTQKYWENNETASGADWYVPSFVTDENGHTEPKIVYSKSTRVTVSQTVGEREESNPYSKDMFTFNSFSLKYNGVDLGDNGTIKCSMSNPKLTIEISDILPESADFNHDKMLFSFEGNRFGYQDSAGVPVGPARGFLAYRSGKAINVTLLNGGKWVLYVKTAQIEKSITFEVSGEAPVTINPYIRNDASGTFYTGSEKTISLVGAVYFYGNVSFGTDSSQEATVTSSNASTAVIEKTVADGVSCFKFTATAAGEYKVRIVSSSNPSVYCDFTFTVSEAPDFAQLLSGTYITSDVADTVYEVAFNPSSTEEPFSGTVTVTQTTAGGEEKSQTFTYSVITESMEISLVEVSGTKLGVDLSVNAAGQLVLNDVYENDYVLQRKA